MSHHSAVHGCIKFKTPKPSDVYQGNTFCTTITCTCDIPSVQLGRGTACAPVRSSEGPCVPSPPGPSENSNCDDTSGTEPLDRSSSGFADEVQLSLDVLLQCITMWSI